MSIIVKDADRLYNICWQRLKNSSCCPSCPPVCYYPVPPPCDYCFCCRKPPICPPPTSKCLPGLPLHSGPLPNKACYDCLSPSCCPPTLASCR